MIMLCRNVKNCCISVSRSRKYSTQKWKGVVGLEVHAQIDSATKLFSGASASFGGRINNNVSLFDAAIPGTLPVLNKKCVESGVLTALALNCTVNAVSLFDRKHYFYADLPTGYQITQQRKPLAKDGVLQFQVYQPGVHKKPYKKSSHIKQIQLEQDSGKSMHDEEAQKSLVDLNRAGVPLMEIVFEPDLEDGEEAASLVKELILILKKLRTCNCKMEEGSLRVDANVSVHQPGSPLGVRSEIKNIGSVRGVANAINFEIKRQTQLLSSGINIVNETRNWDAELGETVPMRDKEEKQDYRFMPEPNLPPLHVNISEDKIVNNKNIVNAAHIRTLIPELPEDIRNKLILEHKLLPQVAITLVDEEILLNLFNNVLQGNNKRIPKDVANFIINELLRLVNKGNISLEQCDEKIEKCVGEIIDLVQSRTINLSNGKILLEEIVTGNKASPSQIIEERDWEQITDPTKIKQLCEDTIKNNPKMLSQYKEGKQKVYKAFLGVIVKMSNNKADMKMVDKILKDLLQKK